jgi:hypothetical protein
MDVTVNGEQPPRTSGTPMVSRELAAAMRESRELRELVREICATLVSQKYPAARVAPWLKRAGLTS